MNVLKNYSDRCTHNTYLTATKLIVFISLASFICIDVSAAENVVASASPINMTDYFKVLLGLVFVIALFLISTYLFKRYGNGPMVGRGQIRLVDGLHLGNRERLVLVEIKNKQLLLSITPGQINKLDTTDMTPSVDITDA